MSNFFSRLIGRSSWSIPLAEPVIDSKYSPRREVSTFLASSGFERDGLEQSASRPNTGINRARLGARSSPSLEDNLKVGEPSIPLPAAQQTEKRRQAEAEYESDADPGTFDSRLSSRPAGGRIPGREQNLGSSIEAKQRDNESRRSTAAAQNSGLLAGTGSPGGHKASVSKTATTGAGKIAIDRESHIEPLMAQERGSSDNNYDSLTLTARPAVRESRSRPVADEKRTRHWNGGERRINGPPERDNSSAESIQVTIGRIEVRAVSRPSPAVPRPSQPERDRTPSLEDYMRKRNRGVS